MNPRTLSAAVGSLVLLMSSLVLAGKPPVKVAVPGGDFELIAEKRGVKVYKHRTSDIIHVGAVGRIPAPPDKVLEAVLDYRGQIGKIARLSESRIVDENDSSLVVYQRLNLPVIDDRDFTLKVKSGRDGDTRWVSFSAVQGKVAKKDGVVRVSHHRGGWRFTPVDGGKATKVQFETSLDIAGSVPKFLARSGAGKELPDLFTAMCKLALPAAERSKCR